MKLYIRLLLALWRAWVSPPIHILDDCVSRFRAWWFDHDLFGHMTNARFFQLSDVSIMEYMMRTRALPRLIRRGWLPHVVYEDFVLRKALRAPMRFTVRTRFLGWDADYVIAQHIFERQDGKTAAEGFTVARFVSTKGERIGTAQVLALLGLPIASPPLPASAAAAIERARMGYDLGRPEEAPALDVPKIAARADAA